MTGMSDVTEYNPEEFDPFSDETRKKMKKLAKEAYSGKIGNKQKNSISNRMKTTHRIF